MYIYHTHTVDLQGIYQRPNDNDFKDGDVEGVESSSLKMVGFGPKEGVRGWT